MQATLIFNANAGGKAKSQVDDLQEALHTAGFHPVYKATDSEEDIEPILDEAQGVIISAGGDGTARAIITRLLDKDLPLVILPMGTANNIAKTLGLNHDPLAIIAGLEQGHYQPFDVGRVRAPWGTDYFVEGAGFGYFADILAQYQPEKGKSIVRGAETMAEVLLQGVSYHTRLQLEGDELEGDYLLVEILNTHAVGPRLKFAPHADPGDGLLDVVTVAGGERKGFFDYLGGFLTGDVDKLPAITMKQTRKLSLTWKGFPFHVDAEVRPPSLQEKMEVEESEFGPRPYLPGAEAGTLTIDVLPQAVRLWLPRLEDEEEQKAK